MALIPRITLLLAFMLGISGIIINTCSGQVYVQLERYNDPESIPFGVGSIFTYKSKNFPDQWQKDRITKIDYEKKVITFNRGSEQIKDIYYIKIENKWVGQLGEKIIQFSAAWFLYGGISSLIGDYEWGWDTTGIGGGALLTGVVLRTLGKDNVYDVKKKNRLRIIDIGWPEGEGF